MRSVTVGGHRKLWGLREKALLKKITKQLVDSLVATNGDLWVWDTEVKGFGVRARPGGRKSYVIEYRPGSGGRVAPKKRYTIGRHGSPWTPDAARRKAIEILGDVIKGEDPLKARNDARRPDEDTVGHHVRQYLQGSVRRTQKSWKETERILMREFVPVLESARLASVSKRDVAQLVEHIARRAPVQAERAFSHIRRFFNWCVEQGLLEANPVSGLRQVSASAEREHVLSDFELAMVWRAVDTCGPLWAAAFKLLILTAQRKSEVLEMEFAELNIAEKIWRIPGRRTKNGRTHEVPLTEQMLKIIGEIPRIEGSSFVFSTSGLRPLSAQSRVKRSLDTRVLQIVACSSDVPDRTVRPWTIHDLRRTATTGMARLGVPPHVADAILNHKGAGVTGVAAIYNRYSYMSERRDALEIWGKHVQALAR